MSASEISHDFSKKYMHRQFIGGILHFVQNDVVFATLPGVDSPDETGEFTPKEEAKGINRRLFA